jgi:hypothetical protein
MNLASGADTTKLLRRGRAGSATLSHRAGDAGGGDRGSMRLREPGVSVSLAQCSDYCAGGVGTIRALATCSAPLSMARSSRASRTIRLDLLLLISGEPATTLFLNVGVPH